MLLEVRSTVIKVFLLQKNMYFPPSTRQVKMVSIRTVCPFIMDTSLYKDFILDSGATAFIFLIFIKYTKEFKQNVCYCKIVSIICVCLNRLFMSVFSIVVVALFYLYRTFSRVKHYYYTDPTTKVKYLVSLSP